MARAGQVDIDDALDPAGPTMAPGHDAFEPNDEATLELDGEQVREDLRRMADASPKLRERTPITVQGSSQTTPSAEARALRQSAQETARLEGELERVKRRQRVLIATPMTLIALLKAVSFGWRQETIAREAHQISEAGSELYKRVRAFAEHFTGMRRGLERAVSSYNRAVGSLERSVLPSARRLRTLGAGTGEEIDAVEVINHQTRQLTSPELVMKVDDEEPPPDIPRVIQTEL